MVRHSSARDKIDNRGDGFPIGGQGVHRSHSQGWLRYYSALTLPWAFSNAACAA
jgi:hypothetical protein